MRPSGVCGKICRLAALSVLRPWLIDCGVEDTLAPSEVIGLCLASYRPEGKAGQRLGQRLHLAVPIVLNRSRCIINIGILSRLRTITNLGFSRACRIGRPHRT